MVITGLAGETTVSQVLRFVPSFGLAWTRSNVTFREMVCEDKMTSDCREKRVQQIDNDDTDTYA